MSTQQKTKLKKTRKNSISPLSSRIKLLLVVVFGLLAIIVVVKPRLALADPHAMFYTDRGQEQVFYNVLAALNQADYVEAPPQIYNGLVQTPQPNASPNATSPPNIDYNTRIGNYLASGIYVPRNDKRVASSPNTTTGAIAVGPGGSPVGLEPQERTNLPHITVRQVTSDNGDAFLRESLQRRALAEQMRVEIAGISCRILEGIYGPQSVKDATGLTTANGKSPCDVFLDGDAVVMGGT